MGSVDGTVGSMAKTPTNPSPVRPGIRNLVIALLSILTVGGVAGSVLTGRAVYAATAVAVLVAAMGLYGAVGRRSWASVGIWANLIAGLGGVVMSGMFEGWGWGGVPLAISVGGWFVARTMYRYMRPAAEMPSEVLRRIENLLTLSTESVAGVRIGARGDGAPIGVGYVQLREGAQVRGDKEVQKFLLNAKQAREVLRKSGGIEATMIGVVPGSGIKERFEECVIVSVEHLAWAVGEAKGPSIETIAAAAEANGITLSREQLRMVERRQGGGGRKSGKKVVHQGRVTKVEK